MKDELVIHTKPKSNIRPVFQFQIYFYASKAISIND